MASTRELRRRIKSIKSTRQITKAMELTAAAKMRRASEATLESRAYAKRAQEIIQDILSRPLTEINHPLVDGRPVKRVLCLAIGSDRGLAGSYTMNLTRSCAGLIQSHQKSGQELHFVVMGKKLEHTIRLLGGKLVQSYPHTPHHPKGSDIAPISRFLTNTFLDRHYDQILIIYTEFYSLLRQETQIHQLLPLAHNSADDEIIKQTEDGSLLPRLQDSRTFLYDPSPETVLNQVLPRLLEARIYQSLQESLASEYAARRLAMKNASDSAEDIVNDLNLTYNSLRQGNITRELAEITGAAAALSETTA